MKAAAALWVGRANHLTTWTGFLTQQSFLWYITEPKFRAVNITLNPTWKKARSFWWLLLITVKKRIKLCMERNTSMLQVQQSVWKGIFRGEAKEKMFIDVALWPRIFLEKKGQMQLGLQERILKTWVISLKFCFSVSFGGLNSYQVCWCCHVSALLHVSSPHFGEATELISEVRHKMPSRPLWHPPALPDEDHWPIYTG